jgi:hypothetical protein
LGETGSFKSGKGKPEGKDEKEDTRKQENEESKKAYRCPWTPFVGSLGCSWALGNGVRIAGGVLLL